VDIVGTRNGTGTVEPATARMVADDRGGAAGEGGSLRYPSMPIAYSQPARLAALGMLFGLEPPAAKRARVLELGCAGGGNIIPLAARFPDARFAGVDLCPQHVEDGRRRIAALGLRNIEIRQGDLAQYRPAAGAYDYVVCHGVFSWVPKPVQDSILAICADALAPGGMAAVSYNVLPGWHLRRTVRDICLRYGGREGPPHERVARARTALRRIADASSAADAYGSLLRTEAARLERMPAAYILGEFLAADNEPCTVGDFMERADRHGLAYLCEADLSGPWEPAPDGADDAGARVEREQLIDFRTGRPFRRSVLVRRDAAPAPSRVPQAGRLGRLHLASGLRPDPDAGNAAPAVFRDGSGRTVEVRDAALRSVLVDLAAAFPATRSLADLLPQAPAGGDRASAEARLAGALLKLLARGHLDVSAQPLRVGTGRSAHPRVWPVARAEAALGQPWLTSLRHDAVPLDPVLRLLVPRLDGRHGLPDLERLLAAAVRTGGIGRPNASAEAAVPGGGVAPSAADLLQRSLDHLERSALLAPDADGHR
jgi:trans-aconitate methyltransferase